MNIERAREVLSVMKAPQSEVLQAFAIIAAEGNSIDVHLGLKVLGRVKTVNAANVVASLLERDMDFCDFEFRAVTALDLVEDLELLDLAEPIVDSIMKVLNAYPEESGLLEDALASTVKKFPSLRRIVYKNV